VANALRNWADPVPANSAAREQPACNAVQQDRRQQDERQAEQPRPGKARGLVGNRGNDRIDDGSAGEVGGEVGNLRVVQQVREFQVSRPQVQAFVLERRVALYQPGG